MRATPEHASDAADEATDEAGEAVEDEGEEGETDEDSDGDGWWRAEPCTASGASSPLKAARAGLLSLSETKPALAGRQPVLPVEVGPRWVTFASGALS